MRKKVILISLLLFSGLILLGGCGEKSGERNEDFSRIRAISQLTTSKCYYHNVAVYEVKAGGLWMNLGNIGYKKLWIEYSGIVELGIDFSKVKISPPELNGVVRVYVPDAEVLNIDFDIESITNPITETGLLTTINADEKTEAFGLAQEEMKKNVASNESLLHQAKERAKKIIEGYIINVGVEIGQDFIVEWIEENNVSG